MNHTQRQLIKEAYKEGYESALNENAIRKLADRAAEYFDVPKITLGQELRDYLKSLNLLKRRPGTKTGVTKGIKVKTGGTATYLGTNKDVMNPFYRRKGRPKSPKTLDRRKLAYDRARLQPLPDLELERQYQAMLDASDVVGEVDLTNIPMTRENMELIRYILARKSGTLDAP